ncbi:type IV secretion protein Rhs [Saccharopolyspora karakumensis]|uniref:Type IV secretion protein Rhs n=2 Tax=Saccharopolyspora karakumensis TaxID=2530386 RepID=A0A4R5BKG6_9PSEU|nr:type IV secretion protein Rhs [Saccharopolyspora karakumensis]
MKKLSPMLQKLGDSFGDTKKALDKIKADNSKNDGPASTNAANADNKPTGGSNNTNQQSADRSPDNNDSNGGQGNNSRSIDPAGTNAAGAKQPNIRDNNRGAKREATPDKNKCTTGDPIDVASGDAVLPQTDVAMTGVLPLVLRRLHLSSYRVGRFFGASWASTLDQRLEVDAQGVSFAGDDGTLLFYPHPTPVSLPQVGPQKPLAVTDEGYTITVAEQGQTLHFGSGGAVLPLLAITDRNGHRIEFDRDEAGVPTEIRHSGGYRIRVDSEDGLITALHLCGADNGADLTLMRYSYQHGRLSEVINASGHPLRFTYDDAGRLTSWTDRNESWYRFSYDHEGRVVRGDAAGDFLSGAMSYEDGVTRWTNSLGQQTAFFLNEVGQVVKEVDPLGNATESEWDAYGRLLRRTDALGRSVRYDYDEVGNLCAITRPDGSQVRCERNGFGLPVTLIDADGTVSHHEYDERGNLTRSTDASGAATTYTYDEQGHLAAVTDALGRTQRVETDGNGLPTTFVDPAGAVTRYERDRFGRVAAIIDSEGGVDRFGYTVDGKLAWRQLRDGTTEQRNYDSEGNLRAQVDALGGVTRTETTHFDLIAAEVRPDGTRLEFAYDTEMRLIGVTNPLGLVWSYDYDPAGRLVRETDFSGSTVEYRYDGAGQLIERVNGSGGATQFRYDAIGNMVERRSEPVIARFTYDDAGLLLEAVEGESRVSFQRDPAGRVIAETINGRTVHSAYDAAGRRIRRRTPSGAESAWEYDARDQPVALHTAGRSLLFEYDHLGREVRRTLGAGMVLNQAWLPNHQLQTQTIFSGAGHQNQHRSFTYRADGLLTELNDQITGPRSFVLDKVGRVLGVHAAGWSERYAYDAAGNVSQASWPTQFEQDALGERVYAGSLIRSAGNVSYEHDDQGRLVLRQRSREGDSCRYFWDAENRLVSVLTSDGSNWRYQYDAMGRRIAKQRLSRDGSVVERVDFTWDGPVMVEQAKFDAGPGGPRVTVWDYEPDTFRPLTQAERVMRSSDEWVDEQFHAVVTDLVGAPTELVNDQGEIVWFHRATLWGRTVEDSRTGVETPLRFPGQYFDAETGLHYNLYRYYDPSTGRYVTQDPLGLTPSPNPHSYVLNPTGWIDPLGLMNCREAGSTPNTRDDIAHRVNNPNRNQNAVMGGESARDMLNRRGTPVAPQTRTAHLHLAEQYAIHGERAQRRDNLEPGTQNTNLQHKKAEDQLRRYGVEDFGAPITTTTVNGRTLEYRINPPENPDGGFTRTYDLLDETPTGQRESTADVKKKYQADMFAAQMDEIDPNWRQTYANQPPSGS